MQDASYLRSQAELCLRIARTSVIKNLAGKFRAAATRYFLRAEAEPLRGRCARRGSRIGPNLLHRLRTNYSPRRCAPAILHFR
jgi:hypothetical protein